jgi:aminobenzoyl-glutamate utilization protein B
MMVAARAMALMGIDLFTDKALLTNAKKEFEQATGSNFRYESLMGSAKPPSN